VSRRPHARRCRRRSSLMQESASALLPPRRLHRRHRFGLHADDADFGNERFDGDAMRRPTRRRPPARPRRPIRILFIGSTPIVPWPATIHGSSNAEMNVKFRSLLMRSASPEPSRSRRRKARSRRVLAHARDFDEVARSRHDDRCSDIQAPAVIGDGHAVIARAGGDHAAPDFLRIHVSNRLSAPRSLNERSLQISPA